MSDTTIPTGTEIATPPDTAPENAAFAAQRRALDQERAAKTALETQLSAVQAKLREREDAEKSEIQRLTDQVKELSPLRDEHGKFVSTLQKLYEDELSSVPDDKREQVQKLSSQGGIADRLEAIRAAKALIVVPATAVGTVTKPTASATNAPNLKDYSKLSIDEIRQIPWSELMNPPDTR